MRTTGVLIIGAVVLLVLIRRIKKRVVVYTISYEIEEI